MARWLFDLSADPLPLRKRPAASAPERLNQELSHPRSGNLHFARDVALPESAVVQLQGRCHLRREWQWSRLPLTAHGSPFLARSVELALCRVQLFNGGGILSALAEHAAERKGGLLRCLEVVPARMALRESAGDAVTAAVDAFGERSARNTLVEHLSSLNTRRTPRRSSAGKVEERGTRGPAGETVLSVSFPAPTSPIISDSSAVCQAGGAP